MHSVSALIKHFDTDGVTMYFWMSNLIRYDFQNVNLCQYIYEIYDHFDMIALTFTDKVLIL